MEHNVYHYKLKLPIDKKVLGITSENTTLEEVFIHIRKSINKDKHDYILYYIENYLNKLLEFFISINTNNLANLSCLYIFDPKLIKLSKSINEKIVSEKITILDDKLVYTVAQFIKFMTTPMASSNSQLVDILIEQLDHVNTVLSELK